MSEHLTDEQLDALEEIAKAATQNTHLFRHPRGPRGEGQGGMLMDDSTDQRIALIYTIRDRDYFAEFDPSTVRKLITALRAEREAHQATRAELEAARWAIDVMQRIRMGDLAELVAALDDYDAARTGQERSDE